MSLCEWTHSRSGPKQWLKDLRRVSWTELSYFWMILLISVSPRWIPSRMVSLRRLDRCWRALQHVISSILTPSIQLKKNSPKILFNGRNKWNHVHWCKQQCKRCNKNTLERNSSSLVCLLTLHFHVIASYLMSTGAWSPVASQHCSSIRRD